MRNILMIVVLILFSALAYAVDSSKPATHTNSWERLHGQAAKANEQECYACHEERVECIECHEDKSPRNHTVTFVQRTHGMESRWNRTSCQVCHREDFCVECHDSAYPMSHTRRGFGDQQANTPNFHCNTSCVLPSGNWKNTPAQNCITCHQTRPILSRQGIPHTMR